MKTGKKLLAIVLSVSLVFTMAVPSFADIGDGDTPNLTAKYGVENVSKGEYNYLVLGDSMTNGYGMKEYQSINEGFNQVVEGSYPDKVAKYLSEELKKQVNLYQYAFTALRAEDVAILLNDEKDNPNYVEEDAYYDEFILTDRVRKFSGTNTTEGYNYDKAAPDENKAANCAQLKKDYLAAVQKADFISLCLGMNNFSMMFWEIISRDLGIDLFPAIEKEGRVYDFENLLSGTQKKLYNNAKKSIEAILKSAGLDDNTAIKLVYDLMYSLASFYINYDKLADRIYELNKDATVAFIGFPNGLRGIKAYFSIKGIKLPSIDIEKIVNILFGARNTFIKYESMSYKGKSFYVDYENCGQISDELVKTDDAVNFNTHNESLLLDGVTSDPYRMICGGFIQMLAQVDSTIRAVRDKYTNEDAFNVKEYFSEETVPNGVEYINAKPGSKDEKNQEFAPAGQLYIGMRNLILELLQDPGKYGNVNLNDAIGVLEVLMGGNQEEQGALLEELFDAVEQDTVKAAISNLENNFDLANCITAMLKSNPELCQVMYVYTKIALGNGFVIHTSADGHEKEADKIIAAYKKFEKTQKLKSTLKVAVPVLVGGVAVALISSGQAQKLTGYAADGNVAGLTTPTDDMQAVVGTSSFMAKIGEAVNDLKSRVEQFIDKIKAGKMYEFVYNQKV